MNSKAITNTLINENLSYKISSFIIILIVSVSVQSVFLSFALFFALLLWDSRFIIPILITIPCIETILVTAEGLTIAKLLLAVIGCYCLVYLIVKRPKIDINASLISLFIIITLLATYYGIIGLDIDTGTQALHTFFFIVFPKLLFALLFYLFLRKKGFQYLKESLQILRVVIPLALIVISIYFIWWGYTTIGWWNVVTRHTFEGADPNEFGCMLSALAVFPLYNILTQKNKKLNIISIIALAFVLYSVTLTLSRGAILTFIFMILMSFIILTRLSLSKYLKYTLFAIFGIVLLIQFGVINLFAIEQRFMGLHINNLSSLTAHRSTFWIAGIKAFFQRPVIGYGNTTSAIYNITEPIFGMGKVTHNMYLAILIRMGLVGLIIFITLLIRSLKGVINYITGFDTPKKAIMILPILALLALCFAALGLSWEWEGLLWYFIAISMASSKFMSKTNSVQNVLNLSSK